MIEKFVEHEVIRGSQVLSSAHLAYNLHSLSLNYMQKLLPDDIDERDFMFKHQGMQTPLGK